ncbi:MAG: glycerol-3-phosphate acyltransferase [Anaerolineae bacterium]|nr:glycerol-3-phosphate acyltransferase [Anaerolineae bacterium]
MDITTVIIMSAVAYLIGSIPVAYIIGRLHGIDIFTVGSGNMGAGNIARAVNKTWGAITWILDSTKGIIAILLVRQFVTPDYYAQATMLGAIAAIIGHNWSVFALLITGKMRGGKGAALAIGTWFVFVPLTMILIVLAVWVLIVVATRFVSLAVLTITALISLFVVGWVISGYYNPVYISYLLVSGMIFFRHRENIKALLEGRERRLGEK